MGCGNSVQAPPGQLSPQEKGINEQGNGNAVSPERISEKDTKDVKQTSGTKENTSYENKTAEKDAHIQPVEENIQEVSANPNARIARKIAELKRQRHEDGSKGPQAKHGPEGRPRTSHRGHRSHMFFHPKMTATQEVIRGNVTVECPSTAKIVRIFTSSTFTDTQHERNALMERVYPALKEVCQQQGYEFQVVDMRWGIRDEATDDHMATELCLREVDLCKKLSTGPYFVTFLSHKYGYRDFPNKIEASEFEKLYECIEGEAKKLLDTWFKRDDNAVPPTYVLHPISYILPDFRSEDDDKRKEAKKAWNKESTTMQDALVKAAKKTLDQKSAHRYLISVTEAEISRGVLDSEDKPINCLWFHRVIKDIDKQESTYLLSRYKDCNEDASKTKESQELLRELRDKKLPNLMAPGHHKTYNVRWAENGIDPETNKEHKLYINRLCKEFHDQVSNMVTGAIELRKKSDLANPLYGEIVEHTVFCQDKCKAFHGRQDTLDLVSKYLSDDSRTPFIVYGPSGCGKTSIVAMTASLARKTFDEKASVIIRFIGTTPDSSTIGALLASVILQIWRIYGSEEIDLPADIKELTEVFHTTLTLASKDEPLVLLLDSLDQFDPAGGARQLMWLPIELPENVKMILSTLPEAQYECFPALEGLFKTKENFLSVPTLDDEDVDGILNKWLEVGKRSLTGKQRTVVLDAFQKCPLPLFLKLSFDEACRWASFSPESQTNLQTSVRGSINALFSRLEDLHGKIFVSKSLAYLTLSKSGLTESELEDILSCDDDVLNDVYMYWTPPVRRLPPLLLVRLKADLGQYLVDRGADGVKVFFWYHRQFIEAATDRYCTDPDRNEKLHSALADFFAGTWANGKEKPYIDKKGNSEKADRKVASQPTKFKTGYNLRKLNNLPHQRMEAKQLDLLKEECLLNFNFLQEKLHASGLRPILDDFLGARDIYTDDDQLKIVGECLQLSQDALITYPKELPSQFLGRIRNKQNMKDFLDDCMKAQDYFCLPDKPILTSPGGQLVHCLADHKGDLQGLDMTQDSKYAVTSSHDKSVKVWDVESGTLVKSIDKIGEDPEKILLCCDDSIVLVHSDERISAHELKTGARVYKIEFDETKRPYCVGGKNNSMLCVFAPHSATLYSADTGKLIQEVNCDLLKENQELSDYGPCCGSVRYAAVIDNDQYNIFIFDLETKQFIHKKEIFHKFKDDDGDEDQYTVDAFVFSHSGEYVYISNIYTNNLHVYKTKTMEEVQMHPGEEKDSSDKFRLTKDGKTLYFANSDIVVVWDLESGERSTMLKTRTGFTDIVMKDLTKAVSISDDQVVRVWDLTRETREEDDENEGEDEDFQAFVSDVEDDEAESDIESGDDALKKADVRAKEKEKKFIPFKINDLTPLSNPRYVLLKIRRSPESFIQIRDLELDKVVRHFKLDVNPSSIYPLNDCKQIVITLQRKIKRVNFMSGEVTSFQGKTNSSTNPVLVRDEKEVVATSRGRLRLKIYDITTGKVLSVMKTDNTKRYEDIKTNDNGALIVAGTDEGPCFIFDVVSRTCLYSITSKSFGLDDLYVNDALITNDNAYLIMQGSKVPAQATADDDSEYILFCWDIKNKCLHKELVDYEYYRKYADDDNSNTDTGIDVFKLLDDRTVISNHNDSYIRVFDITSGEVQKRIDGHQSCELNTVPKGPYFLSHGMYSEDNNFRLVDKTTYETIATFSPDYDMREVSLTRDGCHVVGFFREYRHPVLWKIMGGHSGQSKIDIKPLSSFTNIYGNETVKSMLTLRGDKDGEDDPNDPDTDVDEPDDASEHGTNKSDDSSSISSLSDFDDLDLSKLDNLDLDNLDNLDLDKLKLNDDDDTSEEKKEQKTAVDKDAGTKKA